jgi:amino acid adenylation domain-containing protein
MDGATLGSLFRRQAAATPNATAINTNREKVSYAQLDAWSLRISAILRSHGVRRGDRVALRLAPGADAIAAILGVLHAGAAYVPLDLHNPTARNQFIIADASAAAIIGDAVGTVTRAVPVISEQDILAARNGEQVSCPVDAPSQHDIAYVLYTSGTTGKPKGVPVRHVGVIALLDGTSGVFSFSRDDRWLLFHSLAFDFSVWEMWGALSTGAELVLLPRWRTRDAEACARAIAENRITVLGQTPTAFNALVAAVLQHNIDLRDLRYIIFGGERLTSAALRPWAKRFGLTRPRLVNTYGITETTVFNTAHEVTEGDLEIDDSIIGRPLPGVTARVVTDDGRAAAVAEPGELWLAGAQVAEGYLNLPELTTTRFVTVPALGESGTSRRYYRSGDIVSLRADGEIAYHGRADLQVKLRGHRIELADVEAAVRSHRAVADAIVSVLEFGPGDTRLVCAFVARVGEDSPDFRILRAHVKRLLPSYMQPAQYLPLPELPRTVNGKADRDAVARAWQARK